MNISTAHMDLSDASETGLRQAEHTLSCLSFDHNGASLDLLEGIERHTDALTRELRFEDCGAVVLATCNRFEAYFDGSVTAPDRAIARISQTTGIAHDALQTAANVRRGPDTAHHLFSVASGLESVVVGEGEISGQVHRALGVARRAGATTPALERVFQRAAAVSKTVKRRTRVQTRGRSLVRLALFLAESRVGDWRATRVLMIGTGAYAAVTLAALRERGVSRVAVHSPSGRAEAFAHARGARAISDAELERELADADIVIACSTAHEPLLDAPTLARTVRQSPDPYCTRFIGRAPFGATPAPPRPRLLLDLGMPRNISPDAAGVSGVELLDLELIGRHADVEELGAEAEARAIVRDAAHEFTAAQAERDAAPAVRALHRHVREILEEELARLAPGAGSGSGSSSGSDAVDTAVAHALRHFAGRVLHRPTVRARELARTGQADTANAAVTALFGA